MLTNHSSACLILFLMLIYLKKLQFLDGMYVSEKGNVVNE